MGTVIILILLLLGLVVAASVAFGRTTHEVGSARDTEYLELEGNWIRYRVTGGGPPIVLVHGWLSSSRIWERLADRLAQRFTVYALDLTGFGESDKPITGYGVRYGSRLLYAFCAHFGLTKTAIIGHDVGGAMAVKLAADHPDVVGRIVLVATPANEEQFDLPTLLWLATLPVVGPVFYTLGRYVGSLRKLWVRSFVSDPQNLTPEVAEDTGRSTPAAVTKTLNVTQREISRGRLVRQAGVIKVPVLIVAGEEDQIVDPQATGDWARALPSAEVVLVEQSGHFPMLERASEFNARVLAFLTGDARYLETVVAPKEDSLEEDLEAPPAFEEGPEEPSDAPPMVVRRKQGGVYPARDRDLEDDTSPTVPAEAHEGPDDTVREFDVPDGPSNGAEHRPRVRRRRSSGREDGPVPEVPADLFEWPETWKEIRPLEPRSREPEPEPRDGRDVDGSPEEEPRR